MNKAVKMLIATAGKREIVAMLRDSKRIDTMKMFIPEATHNAARAVHSSAMDMRI